MAEYVTEETHDGDGRQAGTVNGKDHAVRGAECQRIQAERGQGE